MQQRTSPMTEEGPDSNLGGNVEAFSLVLAPLGYKGLPCLTGFRRTQFEISIRAERWPAHCGVLLACNELFLRNRLAPDDIVALRALRATKSEA
jgi:hypothetical protein